MTYQFIEKQVYVNELKISYLEGGIATTSEPILFLHGWGVGIEPYQEVINSLCGSYQVIAPYLPGFGKSSGSDLNWNYDNYANFIISFLNKLNIKKVHLIGHSLGGGIGVTLAASMPNIIKSLILVDSTGIPVEHLPFILVPRAIEMIGQAPQIKFPQIIQVFQGFFYNFLFRTQHTIQMLVLSVEKDLKTLLPKIESPCLLIWGKNDLTTPLTAGEQFCQSIKDSQMIVVDGVYHEWSIFFVDKFTNIVFDFINKIEAGEKGENQS